MREVDVKGGEESEPEVRGDMDTRTKWEKTI